MLHFKIASVWVAMAALPLGLALMCFAPAAAAAQTATSAAAAAPAASDPGDLDALLRAYATVPSTDDVTVPKAASRRKPINWTFNILGYLASGLVFATFWMKFPIRLREVAIASNLVFIAYAIVGHLYPIMLLHATLLPLNIVRLREIRSASTL